MIDYDILCRHIDDWRGGRRRPAGIPAAPPRQEAETLDAGSLIEYEEPARAPEDATMVYQMPEIIDDDD